MDFAPTSPSSYCLASSHNIFDICSSSLSSTSSSSTSSGADSIGASSHSSSSTSISSSCNGAAITGCDSGGTGSSSLMSNTSALSITNATTIQPSNSPSPGIISDLLLHSDLEQHTHNSTSSSPFNYDPFEGFPFLDSHNQCMPIPLFDHFVGSDLEADCDAGYNSGVDLFATNSIICDRSDSSISEPYSAVDNAASTCHTTRHQQHATLSTCGGAAGVDSSNNHNITSLPMDGLAAITDMHNNCSNSIIDSSFSNSSKGGGIGGSNLNIHSYSCYNHNHNETNRCTSLGSLNDSIHDLHNINNSHLDNYRNNFNHNNQFNHHDHPSFNDNTYSEHFNNYNDCINYQTCPATGKRSVLMNLLIDGSDVGAGYTSYNCRALPQRITTQKVGDM